MDEEKDGKEGEGETGDESAAEDGQDEGRKTNELLKICKQETEKLI